MLDPYASCPCGSGKKFKWCCQPIYPGIQQALEQDAAGQHDTALRTIDQVTTDHPGNPEAWGQKARLLFANQKTEASEEALEKAFALNPNYPFGLLLRASMRHAEGELLGSLLLARRAIEHYDPQAREALAQLEYLIFDSEMKRNAPVAARVALERVVHLHPEDQDIRQAFDALFVQHRGRFPVCATRKYTLRKAVPARASVWQKTLGVVQPRLIDMARGFEKLTQQDADDGPAWYNLALARAWLGDNANAVEALDRYLDLESDETAAAEAAMLGEVLRCAAGLEEKSDYRNYAAGMTFRDPEPINRLLTEWSQTHRLIPVPTESEGVFTALVLELSATGLVTVGRPAAQTGRLAAYLVITGNTIRVSSPINDTFDRLRDEMRTKLGLGLGDLQIHNAVIGFHDAVIEAASFPVGPVPDQEKATERVVEQVAQFYEETWIHRPRKSLNGIPPVDAGGSARLKKKLLGIVAFLEDCARGGLVGQYKFDRLRRKLGLAGTAAAAPTPSAGGIPSDLSGLSAAELSALPLEALSDEQLEQAYQTSHRLDAQELAAHFASTLVSRPANPSRPDRYPWHLYLIQKALRDEALDVALDRVNDGERADCEHNGGKRRNDFELLRARVHARRGETDQAADVFQGLIDRTPRNFEVRGQAAKAMLDLKQPARALKFAEDGVTAARQANNRDAEQMLLELTEAAKRAGS